jgi:hypothetical protein
MEAASNSLPLSGATIAQLAADYMQFRQECSRASTANSNGPHSQLLAQLDKAFIPWLEQALSDSQGASDQQGMSTASAPTPYSTDDIPPDVQKNPAAQFQPEDVDRIQNFSSKQAMMAAYRTGSAADQVGVGEHPVGVVRDHMPIATVNTGGDVVVRDHRHSPTPLPPAAPPPSNSGTGFTSGSDYDQLNAANADFEKAKAAALANPKDASAQQALTDAAAALQIISKLLAQVTNMYASIAENSINLSRVQA